MKKPSDKKLCAWWDAMPEGDYTCNGCGRVGPKHCIQPQHPFYANGQEGTAKCGDCIDADNREIKRKRKEELAKLPRCEVEGCNRRETWRVGDMGLCGRHKNKAKRNAHREIAGSGLEGLAMFGGVSYDRESVLKLAGGV